MRRQIIVIFFGLFFSAFGLPALAGAAIATPAAAAPVPNRGALFKIDNGSHTLYLFGTIHVGAPDFIRSNRA